MLKKSFGIDIVPNRMMQVDARVMSPPEIEYGQRFLVKSKSKWDNANKKFFETRSLTNENFKWAFLNASRSLRLDDLNHIIGAIINVSRLHNFNLGQPTLDRDIFFEKENLELFFTQQWLRFDYFYIVR